MTLYNSRKEIKEMGIDDFKDWLFDILNDLDSDILADIKLDDTANTFKLIMVGD